MPKLTINGKEIEFAAGSNLLQVCEQAGVEIPRFCYHDRLSVAGNCRMCLVEVEKAPKPVASCAYPATDGMVVHTDSEKVKQAREGVMEFLLINHPLDCPICDQGGECDLQDIAMTYGRGNSRYEENKRAVTEKDMGPLIKTHMTRCIHCTRCIRFATEVAGMEEIGAIHRGEHMEITPYIEHSVTSELSGNLADICPVGALTSRPYAFQARSWELKHTESIDVLDAVGSNIRIDTRGNQVMRILPRLHEGINEEWISDKSRHACDGLKLQRLDRPYIREKNGRLRPATWDQAYKTIAKQLSNINPDRIAALAGPMADIESMFALKQLFQELGAHHLDTTSPIGAMHFSDRSQYLFNTTINGIEEADLCLLVGANPRYEAAMVGARLRKRHQQGGFKVYSIGDLDEQTYPVEIISHSPKVIDELLSGKHKLCAQLKKAKRLMLVIGQGAISLPDGKVIVSKLHELAEKYKFTTNILHSYASQVGALDVGFCPMHDSNMAASQIIQSVESEGIDLLYLLGADEATFTKPNNCLVVYQGHHGDYGASIADVILPGAAYTEKNATYVNLEGRPQQAIKAVGTVGEAKEDWKIIVELASILKKQLPYNSLFSLREQLYKLHAHLNKLDEITPATWHKFSVNGDIASGALESHCENFYMTDPISRASPTMAACTAYRRKNMKSEAA